MGSTSPGRSGPGGGSSPSPAGSRGFCTSRAETKRRAISSSRCTRGSPKASKSRTSGARARYSRSSDRPRPPARDTAPPRRRAELRVRRLLGALTIVIVTEPDGEVAAALEHGAREDGPVPAGVLREEVEERMETAGGRRVTIVILLGARDRARRIVDHGHGGRERRSQTA